MYNLFQIQSRIRRMWFPRDCRVYVTPPGSAHVLLGHFWKCSSPCQARGPKETGNWKPLVVGGLCGGSGVDACHVAEWWRDHRATQRGWSQDDFWLGHLLQGHCTFRTVSYMARITVMYLKYLLFFLKETNNGIKLFDEQWSWLWRMKWNDASALVSGLLFMSKK